MTLYDLLTIVNKRFTIIPCDTNKCRFRRLLFKFLQYIDEMQSRPCIVLIRYRHHFTFGNPTNIVLNFRARKIDHFYSKDIPCLLLAILKKKIRESHKSK